MSIRFIDSCIRTSGAAFLPLYLFVSLLVVVPSLAQVAGCDGAGNCYVRAGAKGTDSGLDWTNAYTALPGQLTRGVTYFVAAGTYPGHLFADPDSGSTYITVQAATTSSHGTEAGWSDNYAGQAVFNTADPSSLGNILTFQSDYYVVNGVHRATTTGITQKDWSDESGYGFKIDNGGKVACSADIDLGDNTNTFPLPVHHINLEYVDVNGSHETVSAGCRENGFVGMWGSHDYSIENSYIHDTGATILFLRGQHANCSGSSGNVICGAPSSGWGSGSNITVDKNYFANNFSDPIGHAEGCSCSEGLQNLTFSDNYWQDINGTGIIATASGADWNSGNGGNGPWYITGNVVFETSCSAFSGVKNAGVVGLLYKWDTTFIKPIYILNNTIYNFPASCNSGSGVRLDDGANAAPATAVYVQNNLWANAAGVQISNSCPNSGGYASCTSINWSYNAYFATPDDSGQQDTDPNAEVSSSLAPFLGAGTDNFLLASHTQAGANTNSLSTDNETDLRGTIRGADGSWDRGALQLGIPAATLESIAVTPAGGTLSVGQTRQYIATGTYSDGSTQNLTTSASWTSSNSAVASTTSGGLAKALTAGTTSIAASSASVKGDTALTVNPLKLLSISVSPTSYSLKPGQTLQLSALGTYDNGSAQNLTASVTWTSTNTAVASTSSAGLATGVAAGSATIRAALGSVAGTSSIVVIPVAATLQSITVTPATISLMPGTTGQLTATGTYSNGVKQVLTGSVSWISSNSAGATVNKTGLVTAVANSMATIKAVLGSVSGTAVATVSIVPNPVVWWKLSAGSGATAVDSSGNNYTATLHNGVQWVSGQSGSAISANGASQYVSTPQVSLNTKAITWTAWIKRSYGKGSGVFFEASKNFNLNTNGFGFFPDDSQDCGIANTIMTGMNGNIGFTLNCYAQPTSAVWHHFAVVYDKSQLGTKAIAMYIDGVLQKPVRQLSTATNSNSFSNMNMYMFSRGGLSNYAAGQMDDLRLFNKALSAVQIAQIYQQGRTR